MQLAVVDLGFGDAGKGMVTHGLVRRLPPGTITVRFHGGGQAGHTVVDEQGRRHVFSQVGAGTLAGAPSIYAAPCCLHPTALRKELAALAAQGVYPRLWVSEACVVTTPYAQALNRLRESARGAARHGSCGVGVGETRRMADALGLAATIRAGQLGDATQLRRALAQQRDYALAEAALLPGASTSVDAQVLADAAWWEPWLVQVAEVAREVVVAEAALAQRVGAAPALVFEGAQGLLLDERHGFAPHTTPSRCTLAQAYDVLANWSRPRELQAWGVVRNYMVRHGAGPLPTEHPGLAEMVRYADKTNDRNPWQGAPRAGLIDLALLRYAVSLVPELAALAISHVDVWQAAVQQAPELARVADGYDDAALMAALMPTRQTAYPADPLTLRLAAAAPRWRAHTCEPETLAADMGLRLAATGHGAHATAWQWLPAAF